MISSPVIMRSSQAKKASVRSEVVPLKRRVTVADKARHNIASNRRRVVTEEAAESEVSSSKSRSHSCSQSHSRSRSRSHRHSSSSQASRDSKRRRQFK